MEFLSYFFTTAKTILKTKTVQKVGILKNYEKHFQTPAKLNTSNLQPVTFQLVLKIM